MRTRSVQRLLCRLFAGTLLIAQLLVAAHACPGAAAMRAAVVHAAMAAPCEHGGPSSLCAEHCHQGQQSDQVPAVVVPAAVLASLYPVPALHARRASTESCTAPTDVPAPAPPPHAIEHCVFRI